MEGAGGTNMRKTMWGSHGMHYMLFTCVSHFCLHSACLSQLFCIHISPFVSHLVDNLLAQCFAYTIFRNICFIWKWPWLHTSCLTVCMRHCWSICSLQNPWSCRLRSARSSFCLLAFHAQACAARHSCRKGSVKVFLCKLQSSQTSPAL